MGTSVYVEAEYADGYIHREDETDASAYVEGRNVFYDIVERRPEVEHGPMRRFSLITPARIFSVDWRQTPPGAVPIRDKHMERRATADGQWLEDPRMVSIEFGYLYRDEDGQVVRVTRELAL